MGTTNTVREDMPSMGRVQRIAVEDMDKHLATLEAELSGGGAIELVRGDAVIAEVRAPQSVSVDTRPFSARMPDFKAQMREVFGDVVLDVDTTSWIEDDREDRDHIS
ncbi:hypothetical protein [Granulicella mallensis]|jgi:hypothetical protein|uniref:Uncharacterized protein n=1 Tax=Granulicella mallensis TaxID=940614 RepID=A0A7W8ECK2_9BACT|nr:hypothetical protein [Granulicella mallensis]MBB5066796.1 hypothetical protein [Granulicella mallensis]